MKTLKTTLTFIVTFTFFLTSLDVAAAVAKKNKIANRAQLSTDIRFDGHQVGGKVRAPFESLAEVENEKTLDELIGVRQNFSDRQQKTKALR